MPNYVRNIITFKGNQDKIDEVIERIREKDYEEGFALDFNNLIPMPKSISHTIAGSSTDTSIRIFLTWLERNNKDEREKYLAVYNEWNSKKHYPFNTSPILDEEEYSESVDLTIRCNTPGEPEESKVDLSSEEKIIEYGKRVLDNYIEYGAVDWYNWSIKNWGTKWNAMESEYNREGKIIVFDTAWDAPLPVISKLYDLCDEIGDVTFTFDYADEDIGSNCGHIENKSNSENFFGIIFDKIDDESIRFACEVWGYDADDYLEELEEMARVDDEVDDNEDEEE